MDREVQAFYLSSDGRWLAVFSAHFVMFAWWRALFRHRSWANQFFEVSDG